MKHFYKVLAGILLLPAFALAQSNFKPGYAVTLKGDTIRGNIDYREWDTNPNSVTLKAVNGTEQKLTPQDISYFEVTGLEAYKQYAGKISMDEARFNRIQNGRDTSFTTGSYFLKILQQGKVVTIYTYVDDLKPRYFYSTPDNPTPSELVYRVYHDTNPRRPANQGTFYDNGYVKQLSALALQAGVMDDKLQQMMGDADYNQPAILKITTRMNGISKADTKAAPGEKRGNFDLYAGAGLSFVSSKPQDNFKKAGATDYSSALPKVLLGFNVYANPNTRKLAFGAELGLSMSKYRTTYTNKNYPYVGIQYGFDQLIISLTPQITYNIYNSEKFKLFAAVGFDVSKYNYSNKYYKDLDGKDINLGAALYYFHGFINSAMVKVGTLVNKRVQVYGSYIQGGYITLAGFDSMKQSTFQAGVNYFFGH